MKKLLLILTVLLVSFATLSGQGNTDWKRVRKAWDRYLAHPTADKAGAVILLLPRQHCTAPDKLFRHIEKSLDKLELWMMNDDSIAVILAFRLYPIADGSFGEKLDIMLGKTISTQPDLFLCELKKVRSTVQRLDCLVGNFGDDFVDHEDKQLAECKRRIESLRSVRDSALISVRDECIQTLVQSTRYKIIQDF
jgi:hypothetical protein